MVAEGTCRRPHLGGEPLRVGFHRRGIDADALALDQAMRGQTFEYSGEDLVVDFERKAASGAAQPRVIRHSLATQTDVGTLAAKSCQRSAIPGHARCLCLQNNRSVACGSSDLAAATGGRDAAHIPSRIASQRTRRSPPRSAQLAACRRTRAPESAVSPPTKPACPPAVPAVVQETSATSLPRRMARESNRSRFRQRAVSPTPSFHTAST